MLLLTDIWLESWIIADVTSDWNVRLFMAYSLTPIMTYSWRIQDWYLTWLISFSWRNSWLRADVTCYWQLTCFRINIWLDSWLIAYVFWHWQLTRFMIHSWRDSGWTADRIHAWKLIWQDLQLKLFLTDSWYDSMLTVETTCGSKHLLLHTFYMTLAIWHWNFKFDPCNLPRSTWDFHLTLQFDICHMRLNIRPLTHETCHLALDTINLILDAL